MKKRIQSVIIWTVGTVLTATLWLVMLIVSVVLAPFDKQRKAAHAQCYWWADAFIGMNPFWNITAHGLENIDHGRTYVIVANHQSMGDIAIIYKTKMQFKWVAKESLFAVPFIGWSLSLAKHIRLERGDFSSIKKVYREAAGWLRQGMPVLFFPEGTRSETGEMGEFQNGAFKLAIKEGVPVLPLAVKGTAEAIPKGSWLFTTKVRGSVTVLPAIETKGYAPADFERLRDDARASIARSLA